MAKILEFILRMFGKVDRAVGIIEVNRWDRPQGGMQDLPPQVARWATEHSQCPYCHGGLYDGPSGGASQNFYCENVDTCNSAFNLTEAVPEWGQFIGECPPHFVEFIHYRGTIQDVMG